MVYDAFKAHTTDEMKAVLSINSTNLIMVPPGCTSKCPPVDVCVKKPFKDVLGNCWEDYVADIVTNLSEELQNSEKFKLPSPPRQAIVNWVAVRNDKFLGSIMQNINEKIHEEEEGLLEQCDKGPFYNM